MRLGGVDRVPSRCCRSPDSIPGTTGRSRVLHLAMTWVDSSKPLRGTDEVYCDFHAILKKSRTDMARHDHRSAIQSALESQTERFPEDGMGRRITWLLAGGLALALV